MQRAMHNSRSIYHDSASYRMLGASPSSAGSLGTTIRPKLAALEVFGVLPEVGLEEMVEFSCARGWAARMAPPPSSAPGAAQSCAVGLTSLHAIVHDEVSGLPDLMLS